jgi:hypothetical protein
MNEEEDVIGHQTTQGPYFRGKEVSGPQHVHVGADECFPGGGFAAFRGCRDAAALEDIAYCLIADLIAQMSQGACQPVIAPATIVVGHLDDQIFKFFLNSGTSRGLVLVGAIEFVRGEFALPGEVGVRFDYNVPRKLDR